MKKSLILLIILAVLLSCNPMDWSTEEDNGFPLENPIIVTLGPESSVSVEDYQAQVKTYYSNNRSAEPQRLLESYQLSTKIIEGSIYTRVDFSEDISLGISARSVITGPSGTIAFETESGTVEQRIPLTVNSTEIQDMSDHSLFERIDIPQIRQRFNSLNYDLIDDHSEVYENLLTVSTPTDLLPRLNGNIVSSFKLMFDVNEGVIAGNELVEIEEDGTIITTNVVKYYQEKDGVMVPVGEKKDIHYDIPGTITVDLDNVPVISDIEKLPTISEEDFARLQIEDGAYELQNPIIGDPTDPDYTETILTVYESISTNCLDARFFLEVQ